jgi:hypothetical protein
LNIPTATLLPWIQTSEPYTSLTAVQPTVSQQHINAIGMISGTPSIAVQLYQQGTAGATRSFDARLLQQATQTQLAEPKMTNICSTNQLQQLSQQTSTQLTPSACCLPASHVPHDHTLPATSCSTHDISLLSQLETPKSILLQTTPTQVLS